MEGLFNPTQFEFPTSINKEKILKSVVKVRPIRTLEYSFFTTEEQANEFSTTIIDQQGFETIRYGLIDSDREAIANPEFSQALFTHEFCQLIKSGSVFPTKTQLLGNGNGVLVSEDGLIVTNYHLVSGAVEFHQVTGSGYFGKQKLPIKNIEVEILDRIVDNEFVYRKASEVFLVGSFSKTDSYGNKKDLAVLKINEKGLSHLTVTKENPNKFEKIYSIGFSMRTARREDRKRVLGYEDANYDLRISTGLITNVEANSFLADTDGAPGNSGSAAINERGELIGVYCGSTGNGIVDPSKSYRRYVKPEYINQLLNSSH